MNTRTSMFLDVKNMMFESSFVYESNFLLFMNRRTMESNFLVTITKTDTDTITNTVECMIIPSYVFWKKGYVMLCYTIHFNLQ